MVAPTLDNLVEVALQAALVDEPVAMLVDGPAAPVTRQEEAAAMRLQVAAVRNNHTPLFKQSKADCHL